MLQGFGATTWAEVASEIAKVPVAYLTEEQKRKRDIALAKIGAGQGSQPVYVSEGGFGTWGMVIAGVAGLGLIAYLMKRRR